jgi:hypothetical protein
MTVTEDQIDLNGSRNTSHFENESWVEKPWKKFELWYSDFKRGSIKLAKKAISGRLKSFKDFY